LLEEEPPAEADAEEPPSAGLFRDMNEGTYFELGEDAAEEEEVDPPLAGEVAGREGDAAVLDGEKYDDNRLWFAGGAFFGGVLGKKPPPPPPPRLIFPIVCCFYTHDVSIPPSVSLATPSPSPLL